MPEPYHKTVERERRRLLGLERDVHLGEAGADGRGEWLIVEVKCRKMLPRWILDGYMQALSRALILAQENPEDPPRLAIEIVHQKGDHWKHDLVVMRLGDFVDWFGNE